MKGEWNTTRIKRSMNGRKREMLSALLAGALILGLVFMTGCKKEIVEPAENPELGSQSQQTPTAENTPTVEDTQEASPTETAADEGPVSELTLCEDSWDGVYCINTVGLSYNKQVISLRYADGAQTLVSMLIGENSYLCQVVEDYPGNLYCIGALLSIIKDVEVEIIQLDNGAVLARGVVDLPSILPAPTKPSHDYNGY